MARSLSRTRTATRLRAIMRLSRFGRSVPGVRARHVSIRGIASHPQEEHRPVQNRRGAAGSAALWKLAMTALMHGYGDGDGFDLEGGVVVFGHCDLFFEHRFATFNGGAAGRKGRHDRSGDLRASGGPQFRGLAPDAALETHPTMILGGAHPERPVVPGLERAEL